MPALAHPLESICAHACVQACLGVVACDHEVNQMLVHQLLQEPYIRRNLLLMGLAETRFA